MKSKDSKNKVPFTKKVEAKVNAGAAKIGKAITRVAEKLEYSPDSKKKTKR